MQLKLRQETFRTFFSYEEISMTWMNSDSVLRREDYINVCLQSIEFPLCIWTVLLLISIWKYWYYNHACAWHKRFHAWITFYIIPINAVVKEWNYDRLHVFVMNSHDGLLPYGMIETFNFCYLMNFVHSTWVWNSFLIRFTGLIPHLG